MLSTKNTRIILFITISFCFSVIGHAQQLYGNIEFYLRDSITNETIEGAVFELVCLNNQKRFHAISYTEGRAEFQDLPYGNYQIKVTFLGYNPAFRQICLNKPSFQLNPLLLQPSSVQLNEVLVSVPAIRSTQSGDTLSYSANAYKVALGANSESLITKMPGVSVSSEGIEAHGRKVNKVMIDGQEFFGSDVLSALKNIPADMVEDIEIFNKLSDEAELTGVDDGRGYTAINIVTKPERRQGIFGRIYGGYGIPDKYIMGGNLNNFTPKHKLSVVGMANNLSLHNFVTEDIVGATEESGKNGNSDFIVKPLPGISSVQSIGANLNTQCFSGSYFFNRTNNNNQQSSQQENLGDGTKTQLTDAENDYEASSYNHRFSAKINLSAGPRHSFVVRPSVKIQNLSDLRQQTIHVQNRFSKEDIRFLHNRLGNNQNDRLGINLANSLTYRYRFNKRGRFLSFSLFGSYYDNKTDAENEQYTFRKPNIPLIPENATAYSAQQSTNTTERITTRTGITYTEPLSRFLRMSWEYSFLYSHDKANKQVFLLDKKTGELNREADTRQSSNNSGTYLTHKIGPRFQYAFRKTSVMVSAAFQHIDFKGISILPSTDKNRKSFDNPTYEVVANITANRSNTIRIDSRGRTINPAASSLQNVVNLANLSFIRAGNPNLNPSYLHDWGVRYIHTNPSRGSTFAISLNYSGSHNYIGDSLVIDNPDFTVTEGVTLGEGNQFVRSANIGGYHRLQGKVTYGFPVNALRSNLNITVSSTMNILPGVINGEKAPIHRNNHLAAISLSSNISEDLDFRINYSGQYSQGEFTAKGIKNSNDYFSQIFSGDIKWAFWRRFTFTGSLTFQQLKGISDSYNDRILLCNLYLGRRLFRNHLGEISIGINDLFNNNNYRYVHTINASGTNNITNQGIGRYAGIQFVYHLRAYHKKKGRQ